MENKKNLIQDMLKEFDNFSYNEVFNRIEVLNYIIYEDKILDIFVVIHSDDYKIPTYVSLNSDFRDAYKEIFKREVSSIIEFIKREEFKKYDSIHDYYRVKKITYDQMKSKKDSAISKYKQRYESESTTPENLQAIIQDQQKQIDKLNKKLEKLEKKDKRSWLKITR